MRLTVPKASARASQIRRVLVGILFANIIVLGAKFFIGLNTGSLAVLGDGVHASVDAMNNILALVVMAVAARGPDEDHPYGHQKFETLGALGIVVFLSVSGFELVKGAVTRLVAGAEPLIISSTGLSLLIGTLAVNTVVAIYESKRGRELTSELLLADAAHTKADVFITLGVLAGVLLSRAGIGWADPIVALLITGVIVVLAFGIVKRSVPVLVDQHAIPASDIRTCAESVAGVIGAYSIRSRGSSELVFAELIISVDRRASVEAAHRIADAVEGRLREQHGLHEVIVHVEPC